MTFVVMIALLLAPPLHVGDAVEAAPGARVPTCRESLARTREALDDANHEVEKARNEATVAKQEVEKLLAMQRERVRKLESMIGPVIDELR